MHTNLALTVSHNIFITREQRYMLQHVGQTVEVVGSSMPVWIKEGKSQEPAEEIFCKYRLNSAVPEAQPQLVIMDNNGYTMNLTNQIARSLKDFRDEGLEGVFFAHHSVANIDSQIVPVIHYVGIHDIEFLKKTI